MSMDKLISDVAELVKEEYARASEKFGATNHSDHESYAVLLEEVEEAQAEVAEVYFQLSRFWELVKANDDNPSKVSRLLELERKSLLAACELIQVTAMALKAERTVSAQEQAGENS